MRIFLKALILIMSISLAQAQDVPGKLAIGEQIPENLGTGLDGKKIKASDHLGKVMVISFWATWCPPCRKELPVIDNLQRLAGKEHLSVIAINYGEDGRKYRRFVESLGEVNLTFSRDRNMRIGQRTFGVEGIPHMIMVDHEGKIAQVHAGYGDETIDNIVNEVNALFRKQAASS